MKTLHAEFLYHCDLYCIVLTYCTLKCLPTSIHGSHTIEFTSIERENICILVYPQLIILVWFVLLYFSPPPKFSPKLFLKPNLFIRVVAFVF